MADQRPTYRWNLRRVMAERDIYKTTELVPLLASFGVVLSREQVYRLVTGRPERLSLNTLAALCEILTCEPNDLIEIAYAEEVAETRPPAAVPIKRPRRARVLRPSRKGK